MVPKLLLISMLFSISCKVVECATCGEGDWTAYQDQLCYKIIDEVVNRDNADLICSREIGADGILPTTLTIKSQNEQAFLTKFIFQDSHVVDHVWLSAKRTEAGQFLWDDASSLVYTNWEPGSPSANLDNGCSQMVSSLAKRNNNGSTLNQDIRVVDGQWRDAPCTKRNLVVCQKVQGWTLLELQKQFLELKRNPVPVGFIYTQLPSQPLPDQIWPNLIWEEVSEQYAGLFFRTLGGGSAPFGESQEGNSPRLTNVEMGWCGGAAASCGSGHSNFRPTHVSVPSNGQWSAEVRSGYWSSDSYSEHMKFLNSGGEVRPINTAVRIWRRNQ